jgi:hypothetical protein
VIRRLFPVLLAVLALPSVVGMVEASFAVLDGRVAAGWGSVAVDLFQGVATVALALFLLRLGDRPPTMRLWLLDRRVLARVPESSDRA